MIFSKLCGHWSLVTCTFTLSLMYSVYFYAEKIGGYENKHKLFFVKLGCGSEVKMKVFLTFILYFAHLTLTFTMCKLGCTSAMQSKKLHFFFALRSVCTNFHGVQVRLHLSSPNKKNAFFSLYCVRFALTLQCKRRSTVKKGCYVSTPLVCITGKNQFEAADKCVQSLIFCARTSGMPYTLHDAGFSSCTLARPFDIRTASDAVLNTKRNPRVQRLKLKKFQNNIINITFKEL